MNRNNPQNFKNINHSVCFQDFHFVVAYGNFQPEKFSLDIEVVHKILNYKSHCPFSLLSSVKAAIFFNPTFIPYFSGSMILRVHVSQDPCFSVSRLLRVQVFQGLGLCFRSSYKVDFRFKLFTFTSYLFAIFLVFQHKKYSHQT